MKLVTELDGINVVDTEKCYYFGIRHEYDNETFKIHATLWLDFNENSLKIGKIDAKPELAQEVEDIIKNFTIAVINKILVYPKSHEALNLTSEWTKLISMKPYHTPNKVPMSLEK